MRARLTSEQAQQRAFEAARQVAQETGLSGLTVHAVAARSGVATSTIYRSWPSIEDLRFETLDSFLSHVATPRTGDLLRDLETCAEDVDAIVMGEERAVLIRSVIGSNPDSERLAQLRCDLLGIGATAIQDVIVAGVERGDLPATLDVQLASHLLRGPLFTRLVIDGLSTSSAERSAMVRAAVAGMRALDHESRTT